MTNFSCAELRASSTDTTGMVARCNPRIVLYDTTLRDGAQTLGVNFSASDKQWLAGELDRLGVDYVEGGWPGANPTDDAFFSKPPQLHHATLTAFGMTRRPGRSAANDPCVSAVLAAGTSAVCLVGKASELAVERTLSVAPSENLDLIGDSIAEAVIRGREVLFDAEHFFDGYQDNPDYALACLRRAKHAGASWLVLCDTNGGTLPQQIGAIVSATIAAVPGARIGIHTHNDTETAVAGSLAAVAAGARMIQGTLNGLGERCGNANLTTLIPTLMLKLGYRTGVNAQGLGRLTELSRQLDARLNRVPDRHAAYVGENAFAHKAGLHAAAMARDSTSYEHIPPDLVGNRRHFVVSNQSGRANLVSRLADIGIAAGADDPRLSMLLEIIKRRELAGYSYDVAEAGFEVLARRTLDTVPELFCVASLCTVEERRPNSDSTRTNRCLATVKLELKGQLQTVSAGGDDHISALSAALHQALVPVFPVLSSMRLADYQVRIDSRPGGAEAMTRVIIGCHDLTIPVLGRWSTVGVAGNVVEATCIALHDAISYRVFCAPLRVARLSCAKATEMPAAHQTEPDMLRSSSEAILDKAEVG